MSRNLRIPAAAVAVVASAFAFAACSESPVGPTSTLRASDASFSVTGTNPLTIVSDGNTKYCGSAQLNGGNNAALDWSIPASFGPVAGCGVGTLDLTSALNVYNPGWSAPFAGSSWIGITTASGPSSDYRANPGRYVFQETFSVPTGVTNPALDLHVKADNVAAVYLNGTQIGAQANSDCNAAPCNWNSDLHLTPTLTAGTAYTLTFVVADVPTGFPVTAVGPVGGPVPQYGCPTRPAQDFGIAGFSATPVSTRPLHITTGGGAGTAMTNQGAANQAGCENPMGLDFAGAISWTVPVVTTTTWCSPGWWKNQGFDTWTKYHNTPYSFLSTLATATWSPAALGKKAPAGDPTLAQVISNPSTYGGAATNSVADFLSLKAFGTPLGSGVESCPGGNTQVQ